MKPAVLLLVAGCAVLSAQERTSSVVSRDVYLMGTRAQLLVHAAHRNAGLLKLESALATLEDTEAELSTWRASSDISALNRQPVGQPWSATPQLCRMFADVWRWHRETAGAFDPAIGQLLAAWDIHREGAIPSRATLQRALASAGMALLLFDEDECTLTRTANVTIDVGAFGKGEALDRAAAVLGDIPWMINLGGQISVGGAAPPDHAWTIAVANPRRRDDAVLHVRMTTGSLSTSAGSERDLVVNGKRVGHILDPRTGYPAPFNGSVTVWHERGLVADILSTALYVMGPEAGLNWAEDRHLAACYLVPEGSTLRVAATTAFRKLVSERE